MLRSHLLRPLAAAALTFALLGGGRAAADSFPPISAEERALASLSWEPNAPAVVLERKGELWMMDLSRQDVSSRLRVRTRVKVLTEAGKSSGEVSVPHSSFVRLQGFTGRTVLPDGRVVPLPGDAKFERRLSKTRKYFVTSVAFPAVEVGAILDYEYEVRFDSIFYLEPWFFADELPVRRSEIVYYIPGGISVLAWSSDPFQVGIKSETKKAIRRVEVKAWAENLRAVPTEPYALPFNDLAAQMMFVPKAYTDGDVHERLLESWASASELLLPEWDKARRKGGAAARKAHELAAAVKGKRDQAAALFRFVRDQIETEPFEGPFLDENPSADAVLAAGRGDYAEKALLLQALFQAVKIDARPVWAADRERGRIDPQLPNPSWFQKVLVAAEIDGRRVFFDPSDRALGPGHLPPGLEGMPAIVPDARKPEQITLPETPFDQNRRRAALDLALDAGGRLAGTGTLTLTGHHAWERVGWTGEEKTAEEAWKKWLGERFEDYAVDGVAVAESADERKVEVRWTMAQREEEALGDEATLALARPLGPVAQPLTVSAAGRRSPVLFSYGDRDEVELTLRWPEGWRVEARPAAVRHQGEAGAFEAAVEVKEAERQLTYRRRLDLTRRQLGSSALYEAARALFGAAEKSDGQSLVLIRG